MPIDANAKSASGGRSPSAAAAYSSAGNRSRTKHVHHVVGGSDQDGQRSVTSKSSRHTTKTASNNGKHHHHRKGFSLRRRSSRSRKRETTTTTTGDNGGGRGGIHINDMSSNSNNNSFISNLSKKSPGRLYSRRGRSSTPKGDKRNGDGSNNNGNGGGGGGGFIAGRLRSLSKNLRNKGGSSRGGSRGASSSAHHRNEIHTAPLNGSSLGFDDSAGHNDSSRSFGFRRRKTSRSKSVGGSGGGGGFSFLEQVLGEPSLKRSFSKKSTRKLEEELRKEETRYQSGGRSKSPYNGSDGSRASLMKNAMFESEEELMKSKETVNFPSQSPGNKKGDAGGRARKNRNKVKSRSRSEPRSRPVPPPPPPRKKSGRMVGRGVATKQSDGRSPPRGRGRPRPNSQERKSPKPQQQQQQQQQHEQQQQQNRRCHKSMPPLGHSKSILYVDRDELKRRPVSPVASMDSSWRYNLIKQDRRKQKKRRSAMKKNKNATKNHVAKKKEGRADEEEIGRSEPRRASLSGDEHKKSEIHDDAEDIEEYGALIPYEAESERYYVNYNLPSYNLGEGTKKEKENTGDERRRQPQQKQQPPAQSQQDDIETLPGADLDNNASRDMGSYISGKETVDDMPSLGLSYETGDEPWRGRMPAPVTSVGGTYNENATILTPGGTYENGTINTRPDPPTKTNQSAHAKSRRHSRRASSPDSFLDMGGKKGDDGEVGSRGGGEQEDANTTPSGDNSREEGSKLNNDCKGTDEMSVDSLFDTAPSMTTFEKKVGTYSAPPLHSAVRSKKPTARKPTDNKAEAPHHRSVRKKQGAKKSNIAEMEIEVKKQSQVNNRSSPDLDDSSDKYNDQISALTIPAALRRVPPSHARIRAKKPQSSLARKSGGGSNPSPLSPLHSVPESKEDQEIEAAVAAAAAASASVSGPLTGNEIDVHSYHTDKISEVTMPGALHPVFSSRSTKPSSGQKLSSSGGDVPSSLEKASPQLRPRAPPSRRFIPPPPRHQSQQHQRTSAHARTMKYPPNDAATLHESMAELASSFFSNIPGDGQRQQNPVMMGRLEENSMESSLPGKSSIEDISLLSGSGRMHQHRSRSPLHSVRSNNDIQSMEEAVQLSDAAAQLLSLQSGGGEGMKSSFRTTGSNGSGVGKYQQ